MARVEIDLEDAYRGGTRMIELRTPELAPDGQLRMKPRTLRVSIPAGVSEGQQIRLAGQGSPGIGGGPSGDLYLEITIHPHAFYKLEGRDVTLELPVALLGGGARRARVRADAWRSRGYETARRCTRRAEAAPAGSRLAGPDTR